MSDIDAFRLGIEEDDDGDDVEVEDPNPDL